jgi:hypothetical protein
MRTAEAQPSSMLFSSEAIGLYIKYLFGLKIWFDVMDVSFSAWQRSRPDSLELTGASFSFLFDRRYTNRLNRMSRVFFEAYVKATVEVGAQEDRFPSLSEIDARMESGAVYAFKDRLMKNTEFFEEVKISGVSYLVPRSSRFIDSSGVYTDLILNFEGGEVTLPKRRKAAVPGGEVLPGEEAAAEQEPVLEELEEAEVPQPEEGADYPGHLPEPFPRPEELPAEATAPAAPPGGPKEEPSLPVAPPPGRDRRNMAVAIGAALLLIAIGAFLLYPPQPQEASAVVKYSANLNESLNETYFDLDILNPAGISHDMEIALPKDIDRSISARGGVVTISHAASTLVGLNSSSDASIRIYLQGRWKFLPISFSLDIPPGFDSWVEVHGKDYLITRKDDTLILSFNATTEGMDFEQSFSPKR